MGGTTVVVNVSPLSPTDQVPPRLLVVLFGGVAMNISAWTLQAARAERNPGTLVETSKIATGVTADTPLITLRYMRPLQTDSPINCSENAIVDEVPSVTSLIL